MGAIISIFSTSKVATFLRFDLAMIRSMLISLSTYRYSYSISVLRFKKYAPTPSAIATINPRYPLRPGTPYRRRYGNHSKKKITIFNLMDLKEKNSHTSAASRLSNCGRAVIGIRLATLAPHDAVCSRDFARVWLFFSY